MHKWETAGGQYGFHIAFSAVMCRHGYSGWEASVPVAVTEALRLVQLFVRITLLI